MSDSFPIWLNATHILNILFMTFLARSGVEILSAFPKLYLSDHCTPGDELVRFTKKRFAPEPHPTWSSLEEEESWSPLVALPGHKSLGLGRHWHYLTVLLWVATGALYIVLLFASDEWRRLVPTSWSVVPHAFSAIGDYLSGSFPPLEAGRPYNAAQQLAYFAVVFLLAPLQIATGAAMSPGLIGRFPWYPRLFGGRQKARTLHFLGLAAFGPFVVVHTAMVIIHGIPKEFAGIVLGSYGADHALAVVVGVAGLVVVLALNVGATVSSQRRPRAVQRMTGRVIDPVERRLVAATASHQRYGRHDISPFFRVNGHPPQSHEYHRLSGDGFADYRLRVHGLVERPLELSLADLRSLGTERQITMHNCIQGWTNVAEWAGVPLAALLGRCRPSSQARFVVFYAFDDKALTQGEGYSGRYYGSLPLHLAARPQTILALEMNGKPLAIEHGAPVRLRVETQLGFKMVKWVSELELVDDVAAIGMGQGGWREDQQYYTSFAAI